MRLLAGLTDDASKELESFSKWILDIGNGKINLPNNGQVEIDIPSDILIKIVEKILSRLSQKRYMDNLFERQQIRIVHLIKWIK
ncbi:hypothetical protein Bca101_009687 [Brassica carinata]